MNENEKNGQPLSDAGTEYDSPMDAAVSEEGASALVNGNEAAETPEARLAAMEAENAELKDQLLRKAADFDNYRKRMVREKQETFDYANANLLGDLVDSLDNFDRALDAATSANDTKTVVDGVVMIKKQLVSMLESKYNLVSYGAKGDAFDPNTHEGIASVSAPVAEQTCGEVYLKGYKLKERVIRHAKVQVLVPDGTVSGDDPHAGEHEKAE